MIRRRLFRAPQRRTICFERVGSARFRKKKMNHHHHQVRCGSWWVGSASNTSAHVTGRGWRRGLKGFTSGTFFYARPLPTDDGGTASRPRGTGAVQRFRMQGQGGAFGCLEEVPRRDGGGHPDRGG